jgi:hypothetical protein
VRDIEPPIVSRHDSSRARRAGSARLAAALAAALLVEACAKPPPPPPPTGRPRFDPGAGACVGGPPSPPGWQSSAPRPPNQVHENQDVQVALRATLLAQPLEIPLRVELDAPNGSTVTIDASLRPPEWAILRFPGDFPLGTWHRSGVYTVLWSTDGQFLACDGFEVLPRE